MRWYQVRWTPKDRSEWAVVAAMLTSVVGVLVLIRTFVNPGVGLLPTAVLGGVVGFALARGRNLLQIWLRRRLS